jgi:hypothetical protein
MPTLVLFSKDYQPTIHTTVRTATVKYYHSDDIYSDAAHANVGDDQFAFYGGLNMLIQSIYGNKYNHMYVVNHWKKSEFAVAKLSGLFPVMVELTQDAIQMIDSLSNQNLTNKL